MSLCTVRYRRSLTRPDLEYGRSLTRTDLEYGRSLVIPDLERPLLWLRAGFALRLLSSSCFDKKVRSDHCVKCLYSEFFWSIFSRIRTECVSLCIQSECGKIRTRKIQNTETFHATDCSSLNPFYANVPLLKPLDKPLVWGYMDWRRNISEEIAQGCSEKCSQNSL